MSISLIAAMDRNRAIGFNNKLLWRLPAEMAFFTRMTTGKTVVMGRKTRDSLPKPLVNRRNIVLTLNKSLRTDSQWEYVFSMEEILKFAENEEIMVIGGAEIYKQFLPYADTIYLTLVHTEIEQADTYFPVISEEEWEVVEQSDRPKDEKNMYDFTLQTLKSLKRR